MNSIKNWIKIYTRYDAPSYTTTYISKLNYLITF